MKNEVYYNIHDILKVRIRSVYKRYLFPEFNFPFHCFSSKSLSNVDIEMNIGPFKPSFAKICPVVVDHHFYAGDDYLYIKDFEGRLGRFVWDVEIIGIDREKTKVNFSARMPIKVRIGYPDLLPQLLVLQPLLYLKLAKKDSIFMHAAGMQKEGNGFVLAGRAGAHKTSLLMDLVRRFGWESLGDENIIISDSRVLSFHRFSSIFRYQLDRLESEKFPRIEKIRFALSAVNNRYVYPPSSNSSLNAVFVVHCKNTDDLRIDEISREIAVRKLYSNNLCEWFRIEPLVGLKSGRFFEYISMYSFANPFRNVEYLWGNHLELLQRLASEVPIYSVEMPAKYNAGIAEKFNNLIGSLVCGSSSP